MEQKWRGWYNANPQTPAKEDVLMQLPDPLIWSVAQLAALMAILVARKI